MSEIFIQHWPTLILMAGLLGLSGFFSGSETAFFSLKSYEVRRFSQHRSPVYRCASRLISKPQKLLITILFGNMVVNIFFFSLSISLEATIQSQYGNWGVAVTGILTVMLVIIVGEVSPKAIALTIPHQFTYLSSFPLRFLQILFGPVVKVLEYLSQKILGDLHHSTSSHPSLDELKEMMETSERRDLLTPTETRLIKEILDLESIQVKEVMIPRVKVQAVNLEEVDRQGFYDLMSEFCHTYYPVYRENIDEVEGAIHSLAFLLAPPEEQKDISHFIRDIPFVTEFSPLSYVLELLKERNMTLAAVVDEYGGFSGIVTLEDTVEEIFGEFRDEFDPRLPPPLKQVGPEKFVVRGSFSLRDLGEAMGVDLEATKVSTISGLITSLLDSFPSVGDEVIYESLKFKVTQAEDQVVETALVEKIEGEKRHSSNYESEN